MADSKSTLTQLAVQRLENIRNDPLPDEVREKATLCLVDYLGARISGLSAPWAPSLLQYARHSSSSAEPCHLIGLESPVSAEVAAFVDSSIAHSIIRDDMHLGSGAHIGVLVIPAVLALAQRDRWNGTQLLKGVVGGYEMAVALGESIHHSGLRNPHFRASGMIGAFGAAGAGIVADDSITSDKAMNALGFAVNFAAGMNEWAWSGGLEIYTHMGTASRGGITSIDLARAGLYSSDTVLEGKDGVFNAYGCGNESAGKFRAWLKEFDCGAGIMGARFKPVAGCNFIQTPLAVALRLSETLKGRVQQIESIRVVVTTAAKNYPGCNSYGPFDNINSTKMSIQYGVSAALILGRMDELAFRQYGNHELQALMRKCVIETDDSYDQAFSERRQPSRVEIRLQDGTKYQDSSEDVPWLDGPAVEERFYEEAAQSYSSETAVRIVKACHTLEDETTCAALLELLSSHGANRSLHRSTADLKETSRL